MSLFFHFAESPPKNLAPLLRRFCLEIDLKKATPGGAIARPTGGQAKI